MPSLFCLWVVSWALNTEVIGGEGVGKQWTCPQRNVLENACGNMRSQRSKSTKNLLFFAKFVSFGHKNQFVFGRFCKSGPAFS
jgi:hypothetical protein